MYNVFLSHLSNKKKIKKAKCKLESQNPLENSRASLTWEQSCQSDLPVLPSCQWRLGINGTKYSRMDQQKFVEDSL